MKRMILVPILALAACRAGDIGTTSQNIQTTTSTQTGISDCTVSCEPVTGGWAWTEECSGQIQDGPNFAAVKPGNCTDAPTPAPTAVP